MALTLTAFLAQLGLVGPGQPLADTAAGVPIMESLCTQALVPRATTYSDHMAASIDGAAAPQ